MCTLELLICMTSSLHRHTLKSTTLQNLLCVLCSMSLASDLPLVSPDTCLRLPDCGRPNGSSQHWGLPPRWGTLTREHRGKDVLQHSSMSYSVCTALFLWEWFHFSENHNMHELHFFTQYKQGQYGGFVRGQTNSCSNGSFCSERGEKN